MPPYIVGILQGETATSYLLTNVLEFQDGKLVERKFSDTLNRTYVYRVEILGLKPEVDDLIAQDEEYGIGGGLG